MGTVSYLGWDAKYAGVCVDCGERFSVGTRIRWAELDLRAGEGRVAHVKCPDDGVELFSGSKEDACPECHVVHRGDCW